MAHARRDWLTRPTLRAQDIARASSPQKQTRLGVAAAQGCAARRQRTPSSTPGRAALPCRAFCQRRNSVNGETEKQGVLIPSRQGSKRRPRRRRETERRHSDPCVRADWQSPAGTLRCAVGLVSERHRPLPPKSNPAR